MRLARRVYKKSNRTAVLGIYCRKCRSNYRRKRNLRGEGHYEGTI